VAAEALAWAAPHLAGPGAGVFHRRTRRVRPCRASWASKRPAPWWSAIAAIARGLVQRGVRQLIVAGGETSGACVQALGITQMRSARRSTPACRGAMPSLPERKDGLHITLKSGNFGTDDFFTKAFTIARMTAFMDRPKPATRSAASAAACSSAAMCTPRRATSACAWTMAS
jgi:hypothetical protein